MGRKQSGVAPQQQHHRQSRASSPQTMAVSRSASSLAGRSSATRGGSPKRSHSSLSCGSTSPSDKKYSLLLARLPRGEATVELEEVDFPAEGRRKLLPKLTPLINESTVKDVGEKEHSPSRWRAVLDRARSPIAIATGARTSLGSKNGRSLGDHEAPFFDGAAFYTLEPLHDLDAALKDNTRTIELSLWLIVDDGAHRTEQQCVLHVFDAHEANYGIQLLLNTNDVGHHEPGCTLLSLRDAHGKKYEVAFTDTLTDGRWHSVLIRIQLKEKNVVLFVDDKPAKPKGTPITDNVSAFHETRPKVMWIGAAAESSPTDNAVKVPVLPFYGSLMDFLIADTSKNVVKKIMSFPFRTQDRAKEDATFQQQPLQGDVTFVERLFPATSPALDGYENFINVGPLADLGLMLAGTAFEIVFRTVCNNEKMCLMGVTDNSGKNPGFGIDLNVNAQGSLQRYMTTFWIQDRLGSLVRATCELSDAFDDKWHTLSVRIVEQCPFRVKFRVDGRHVDALVHHVPDSHGNPTPPPKDFVSYSQFVAIGAMNQRGEIWRPFRGSLRSVRITRPKDGGTTDEPFAHWPLNEGPGAVIATDSTSHGFHGIYFLSKGVKGSRFLPSELEATEEDALANETVAIVRHTNNLVSLAVASIEITVDEATGFVRECVRDWIKGQVFDRLEQVPHYGFNPRAAADDRRVFQTLDERCFVRVTPADYMNVFRAAIAKVQDQVPHHTVVVLRLGDANFTALDLCSMHKSPRAMFVPSQLVWTDAVSIFGHANKRNFAIANSLTQVDKLLLQCGTRPQLYKRSTFQRLTTHHLFDSFLPNVLTFALCATKEPAQLAMVTMMSLATTAAEGLHGALLVDRMRVADRSHAAVVIQKAFRWKQAYRRFAEKSKLRHEADARKEKITAMRRQFPKEVLEKDKRLALLVVCNEFDYDPCLLPSRGKFDDLFTIPRLFEALGFQCEIMLNPSRKNLLEGLERKKKDQAAADASLFVHVIGVGANVSAYTKPPSLQCQLSWCADTERAARLSILRAYRKEMIELYGDDDYEFQSLFDAYKAQLEELEKKNAKKKKGKGAAAEKSPLASLPVRGPRPKPERLMAEMTRWETVCAPAVPLLADQIEKPTADALQEPRFLCTGETRSAATPANTVSIDELKQALQLSESAPVRGDHTIFSYDCVPLASALNASYGFGALTASSGESISIEYKPDQTLLLTYYLKRCLQGCAVDCVRVGKHDPPSQVTMEIACRYMQAKLDPHEGRFPARSCRVHWFGEYVGDMYVARKIVAKKEERRKIKQGNSGKKLPGRLMITLQEPIRNELRPLLQTKLTQLLKLATPFDVRKILPCTFFDLFLDADPWTLQSHQLAKDAMTSALCVLIHGSVPSALTPPLTPPKWYAMRDTNGAVRLRVYPIPERKANGGAGGGGDDNGGESKDVKQQAFEFYESQEQLKKDSELFVMTALGKLVERLSHAAAVLRRNQSNASVNTSSLFGGGGGSSSTASSPKNHSEDISEEERDTVLLGGFPIRGVELEATVQYGLTEEESLKLDRHCRLGTIVSGIAGMRLSNARLYTDKELQDMEQQDRLLGIEEARRQAEAKQRLVQEAEARKKAEEALQKLHIKKESILDKIGQIKTNGQLKSAEEVDQIFSVPLAEALVPALDVLIRVCSKDSVTLLKTADAVGKLRSAVEKAPAATGVDLLTDAKFVSGVLRLSSQVLEQQQVNDAAALLAVELLEIVIVNGVAKANSNALTKLLAALFSKLVSSSSTGSDDEANAAPAAVPMPSACFTKPGLLRELAVVWATNTTDDNAQCSPICPRLAPSLRDILSLSADTSSLVMSAFGVSNVAAAVVNRSHHTTDDVRCLLQYIAHQVQTRGGAIGEVDAWLLDALSRAVGHTKGFLERDEEEGDAALIESVVGSLLTELTCPWSGDVQRRMCDAIQQCNDQAKEHPKVVALLQRVTV